MSTEVEILCSDHKPLELTGDVIRRLPKRASCTQARLAERLGVTENTVWYWEHDPNNPRDPEHMIELLELSDPDFTPRDQRDRETFTVNEGGQWTEPSVS